jgi:GLPGLI family protein
MKKQFLTLICSATLVAASAQNSAKVTYEEKVKLEIKLDGADSILMGDLPKEHILKKELYFNADASLYQNEKGGKAKQDLDKETEGGRRMVIRMDEPDDKVFCDLKNNKRIEQRDFMTRKFLIESDLNKMEWKLTGKQKTIMNYPCQEAVLKDTSKKVIVWFTSAIPVSTGPGGYSNLPGLILAVDIDNGKLVITAINIDKKEFDTGILLKPNEGKKVTKEQFNKIVADKRKEMQEQNGGNGDVIIKIRN